MGGRWEKDRCIKCTSVSGLTVANYESAYEWAERQDAAGVIPPLLEAIGGLRVDMSRFLRDASSKGWDSFVQFLQDKLRQDALHMACKEGNMDEVKRLLWDGAEIDEEDKDGFTALDVAILNGHFDIARELCKKMNIDTYWLGESASSLHWAAGSGRVNVVKELIDKGGDIEVKGGKDGCTPLHFASWNGHLNVVKFLVENKADIEVKNKWGQTSLYLASFNGLLNVIKFLVENKADINTKDNNGWTTLHYASRWGNLNVAKFLVESKADVNAKGSLGRTPLDLAKQENETSIADYLKSKGGVGKPSTVRSVLTTIRGLF